MPISLTGFLGQTNNYTNVNDLITKWPTAAQNQGVRLFGVAFDGVETDYLNPTVISNLTLATNENPKSWLSYGSSAGIGVPSSYDGWFTDPTKVRAEINHNPNTNQSQVLKLKWADNQDITSTTIDLSALSPKTSPGLGDQGNEVGFLQIFNNGVLVPTSNFTITRLNAPIVPKPITVSPDGVTFTGDRTDGSFKFKIEANPLSGITFDELRFSTKAYDSPTAAYLADPFKEDGSDYLLRNIEYQGTEDPISLQFSAPTFSVNENGTPIAALTVKRIGSSIGTASATLNLTNGSAIAPGDYISTPLSINFANGDTADKIISIPIIDDTLVEGNETINLSLTNPTGSSHVTLGTQNTAILNIVDNDIPGTLQFSSPTFSVNENGTPIAAVTVTRTGGSTGAVSATVNLSNGTALAPGDYTNAPILVNFANGDTAAKTVTIPIVNDTLVEGNETVNLSLGSPTGGATIGAQNAATLTIVDNDIPGTLQFSAPTFSVNEDGTPIAAVTVTRTGGSAGAVSATVNLTDGSAIAPGDYNNSAIAVNFASGDSAPKTVTIPIVNDTLVEGNETVNLSLGSPTGGATIGTQSTATLNIVDNDIPGTLQFSAPTFSVNEDGTPIAAVTVTRTGGSAGAVSATVNLTDGSAIAPGDYNNSAIAVNFASGDSAPKTVTIPIVNDTLVEGNETVNLSLGSPTGGATIGTQSTASLNIVDDDVAPAKPLVSVNSLLDPIAGEPFNPQGDGLFQFTRTGGDISQPLTIRYTVTGTATPGLDYSQLLGTVTIDAGEFASDPVTVSPLFDFLGENEATESVIVKVAEDPAYQVNRVGSADTASVSILDDNPLTGTGPDPVLLYDSTGFFVGGFSNITSAVAASIPNDIILAKAGTYNEPGPIVINQPLTLRGPNGGLSPSGTRLPEAVVRTTTLGQPVFQIAPGVDDVTIEGFTIQMNGSNAIQQLGFGTDIVIRQNTFTGTGPNFGSVIALDAGIPGFGAVEVVDNLINSVSTTFGSNTSGIQASQFDTVRITDNQIANLSGAGIVADSITDSGLASGINSNKVSNVRQDGIRLQGGNTDIENNDITNVNTSGALTRGGIRLQDSILFGGLTLGTVDVLSNVIANSVNGVAIASGTGAPNVRINYNDLVGNSRAGLLHNRSVTVDATENWWDSPTGPIVGGIGPNRINGTGAGLVSFNPFATAIL
jgi:Calx-beta domain